MVAVHTGFAPVYAVWFGKLKFGGLKILNISPRNSSRRPSPQKLRGNCLEAEKSRLINPGPSRTFLPELPKNPAGWIVKAQGSYHRPVPPTGVPKEISLVPTPQP